MAITTIQIDKKTQIILKDLREYPKQSYNDLLVSMIDIFKMAQKKDQYDKFIHTAQSQKMKELWDNAKDEQWKDA
jgi:hypothetical protein